MPRMKANIDKEWRKNRPSAESALKKRKTETLPLKAEENDTIRGFVKTQAWPCVVIKDAGVKGEGIEPFFHEM